MPTNTELNTLIQDLQTAVMEYIVIAEGNDTKEIPPFKMARIKDSTISATRKEDITQMQTLCQAALRKNYTALSLAEIITVYFKTLQKTGPWGISFWSGNSRLREKVFAVVHSKYPLLTLNKDEQERLKPFLKVPDEIGGKEKIAQLENLLKKSQSQTQDLEKVLARSQQQNIALVKKVKTLETDIKTLNKDIHTKTGELTKEKAVNLVLRNTIRQRDECIRLLTDQKIAKAAPKAPDPTLQEKAKHFVHFKAH